MGLTLTRYLLSSLPNLTNDNALPITNSSGTVLTMGSNEFPIKLTVSGYVERTNVNANANATLYVSKSDRTSTYKMSTFWLRSRWDDGTTLKHTGALTWETFSGSGLKGQSLYIASGNVNGYHNLWEIKVYTHYTISAPSSVSIPSTASGIVTLTWSASTVNDGALSYYNILACDRANSSASWGSWYDLTTSNSTSALVSINPNNGGQRKYRVCAIATNTAYNSGYQESGVCTSSYATVSAGQIITKAQMDTLRTQRIAQMT